MSEENNEVKQDNVLALKEIVERQEKANSEAKSLIEEQKQLIALQKLGGQVNSGIQALPPKEETPLEYSRRIIGSKR